MTRPYESPEHELVSRCLEWLGDGEAVYVATIVAVHGSSPRPPGSQFALAADGRGIHDRMAGTRVVQPARAPDVTGA